ncbi:hypothetical protein [Desulfofundulus salinus]|uniref:Uncharacterized protein n=1 Tax=Desulfofundulus salinus TaxID=2419843 RepID=A0A494WYT8_9FIRM|nr:hypothetical protein [Desulfofundulus salinum]RKO65694.1 hypothetical protein D7024_01060 [Desulfofundulus salinum]
MNTGVIKEAIKLIKSPEKALLILIVLLTVKHIDPETFIEVCKPVGNLLPDILNILKIASLAMAIYGVIGSILTLLCWIIESVRTLLKRYQIYLPNPPSGWHIRTVNGVLLSGFAWMWVSIGLIYLLGGETEVLHLYQIFSTRFPRLLYLLAIPSAFVTAIILAIVILEDLTTPQFRRKIIDVRVVGPTDVKITEPVTIQKPRETQIPLYHQTSPPF